MNAHLETNLSKGFLLTEENLIKLDDIIRRRITVVDPAALIKFKVFRADGMLVEFDNPAAVAAEENSSRNAIKRVELISTNAAYKLRLKFDPKDNTDIEIEANDRDLAYLLSSDVKEYLHAEVLKFRSFSFDSALTSRNLLPFFMLPFMGLTLFMIKEGPNSALVSGVLKTTDLHAKLNFLIEQRMQAQDPGTFKYAMFGIMGTYIALLFVGGILDRYFPRNIFYWGKVALAYDRMLATREKVIWGIVVAFVIGIASTVAVDYYKSPQKVTAAFYSTGGRSS